MSRILILVGLISASAFFIFFNEGEQEDSLAVTTTEIAPQSLVVKVEQVLPPTHVEPETTMESVNHVTEPVVTTTNDEWVGSENMLEPVLEKPPVVSLRDSDDFIRAALVQLFPDFGGELLFEQENVLQRLVTLINDVAQGDVLFKHRIFLKPAIPFSVITSNDILILNPNSYHRFDEFVNTFTQVNVDAAMVFLNENRSLINVVFKTFSHADDFTLNKMFLSAIDAVLNAPVITEEITLKKKLSRFEFANPDYEALTSVDKQMIRLGPKNTIAVQTKLKVFRIKILDLI